MALPAFFLLLLKMVSYGSFFSFSSIMFFSSFVSPSPTLALALRLSLKMLVFGENKIEAERKVINYSGRLDYCGKMLGFMKNKTKAELYGIYCKVLKMQVFGKKKIEAEHNVVNYIGYKFRGSIFKSEEITTQAVFIG